MGMHPQLRQVPPSSARSIRVDVRPQLRRAQRRHVSGRAAAQHHDAWLSLSVLLRAHQPSRVSPPRAAARTRSCSAWCA